MCFGLSTSSGVSAKAVECRGSAQLVTVVPFRPGNSWMGLEFSERGKKMTQDRLEHFSPWVLHGKPQRWGSALLPMAEMPTLGRGGRGRAGALVFLGYHSRSLLLCWVPTGSSHGNCACWGQPPSPKTSSPAQRNLPQAALGDAGSYPAQGEANPDGKSVRARRKPAWNGSLFN